MVPRERGNTAGITSEMSSTQDQSVHFPRRIPAHEDRLAAVALASTLYKPYRRYLSARVAIEVWNLPCILSIPKLITHYSWLWLCTSCMCLHTHIDTSAQTADRTDYQVLWPQTTDTVPHSAPQLSAQPRRKTWDSEWRGQQTRRNRKLNGNSSPNLGMKRPCN